VTPARDSLKRTLIPFVKSPVAGECKTRLMPNLNAEQAASLYKCFVIDLVTRLGQGENASRVLVAYQPHPRLPDLSWLGLRKAPDFFRQEGKSLGERLAHAFGIAFGRGARQVVLIGSDSPTIPEATVEQAFAALNDADVVVGPAIDGGYYLIGLSRPCLNLFENVAWSTDQVFERTVQIAQEHGYRLRVLPTHYDVDTVEDLAVLNRELATNPALAPSTQRALSQLFRANPALVSA
jgi:rSAM/selenodomain-associated transferase 1